MQPIFIPPRTAIGIVALTSVLFGLENAWTEIHAKGNGLAMTKSVLDELPQTDQPKSVKEKGRPVSRTAFPVLR